MAVALSQNDILLKEWLGVVGSAHVRAVMRELETVPSWLEMNFEEVNSVTHSQFDVAYLEPFKHSKPAFVHSVLKLLSQYFKTGVAAL